MKQILKNLCYYLGIPMLVIVIMIASLNWYFCDLEKAITLSATILQSLAIFIGGLWAYHKFDWVKRAESAIKIKAMLMEFEEMHQQAASQYRMDQSKKLNWFDCWKNYALQMMVQRNNFITQVHLACYLPKKIRKKIFDIVWLPLNKGQSPQKENLDKNWEEFGREVEILKEELDNLVSK